MLIGENGRRDYTDSRHNYREMLRAHPEIRGLFATFAAQGDGAALAVHDLQLRNDVQILAFDFDEDTTRLIVNGDIRGTVGQDAYLMGYVSMILAYYARHVPLFPTKHDGAWRIAALTEFLNIHPDINKHIAAKLSRIIAQLNEHRSGPPIPIDTGVEILGKDELLRVLAQTVEDMRDSLSDKIVALSAEIEERKYAQEALQQLNEALDRRVAERSRQLEEAHAHIVKLERDALEIQMAGGFAHEMRNVLTGAALMLNAVITGEQTLCQKTSDNLQHLFQAIEPCIPKDQWDDLITCLQRIDHDQEMVDTVIKKVVRCINNALDITTLILEYAKLGKTEPGHEPVNLRRVIEGLLQEHQQAFAEQQITIRTSLSEPHPVIGNPAHFSLIFNNIMLNARDALLEVNDDRARCLEIALTESPQRQQVSFTDNGIGISTENHARIFEPFFSTKPTTGTGLGLSFVSKLMPLYQGAIDVQSESGKGTTFTLTFPLS